MLTDLAVTVGDVLKGPTPFIVRVHSVSNPRTVKVSIRGGAVLIEKGELRVIQKGRHCKNANFCALFPPLCDRLSLYFCVAPMVKSDKLFFLRLSTKNTVMDIDNRYNDKMVCLQ